MNGMRWTCLGAVSVGSVPILKSSNAKLLNSEGILAVVKADDDRLSWPERELIQQLGEKLYGKRKSGRSAA